MKLKAILFDMDGVLVDSEPRHGATCEAISRMISHGRLGAKETHTIGTSTVDMYAHALEMAGETGDPQKLSRMHFEMTLERVLTELPEPDTELVKLLDQLRDSGLLIAVVSTSPKYFAEPIMQKYGFTERFATFVSGDDVTKIKPDPQPYLIALDRLGLFADEAVAVEDSRVGSLAAKNAHLRCIGYVNPGSGDQDLSATDVLAHTYAELGERIRAYAAE